MAKAIKLLRMLPAIVIARFGSSPTPMENYDLQLPLDDKGKPTTDFREIVPAQTLAIDPDDGSVADSFLPAEVRFRDAEGRIKPVSPFLEVWVQFEDSDDLIPLTADHLGELGLTPAALRWRARAANRKPFRRTGDPRDMVGADTGLFSDHSVHPLVGVAPNFKPGKSITLGNVRYIRPTKDFPEIRVRFTPGKGLVFGPRTNDPRTFDDVYAGQTSDGVGFGGLPQGEWDRYYIGNPGAPPVTAPGDIFQGVDIGTTSDSKLSSGYFDDTCDGIVEVSLEVGGKTFEAYGRFASAVPDFAPDSLPVRSILDDIEQMALGPDVAPPADDAGRAVLKADVENIIRRALDTVRQINTMVMNGDEPIVDVQRNRNNMPGQEGDYGRKFSPIFDKAMAEYRVAVNFHKDRLQAAMDNELKKAFDGGLAFMRKPEEVADLRDDARHKMPAMMRGNEGSELVLTRRQIAKLALADSQQAVAAAAAVAPKKPTPLSTARVRRPKRTRPPSTY
ncbi:MAG: hypothetical protein WA418_33855 [Bradyrhizobium sp.]